MLDLKNFSVNNQVSINALLTSRKELSDKRNSLISECMKYQKPFDKSYLKNPEYIKMQETLKSDLEIVTHISNCINLYVKYGNISGKEVQDDRPVINNFLEFEKATKESFKNSTHRLGVLIIWNKITKTSEFQGIDEYICVDFCIDDVKNHKEVENRFQIASNAIYEISDYFSVNDYIRKGHRVLYGYRDENNQFFETGYIS
jgi:hypothetical protein